eukprot:jgi/Chrzof1/4406/Cz14g11270.t1
MKLPLIGTVDNPFKLGSARKRSGQEVTAAISTGPGTADPCSRPTKKAAAASGEEQENLHPNIGMEQQESEPDRRHKEQQPGPFNLQAWAGVGPSIGVLDYLSEHLRKAKETRNCWTFLGDPIDTEDVLLHWPERQSLFSQEKEGWTEDRLMALSNAPQLDDPELDKEYFALFHFRAVHLRDDDPAEDVEAEEFTIELGDPVTVGTGAADLDGNVIQHKLRVTELFVTPQGQRCFKAHWFYEEHDTAMACRDAASQKVYMPTKEGAGDKSRLWLATVEDNEQYGLCYDLNVIAKKIRVFKVTPGKTPQEEHPSFNPKHDYWYSQIHTTAHITNEDCYYDYSPWSELYKQAVAEGPAAVRQLRAVSPTTLIRGKDPQPDDNPKDMNVLDIFAGAGGLSFLCGREHNASLKAKWAVDFNASACASYQVNHPDAVVFHQGLDEFTMMCKMVQKLYSQYLGKGWTHEQLPGILAVAEQQEKQEQADDNDDSSEKVDPDTSKVVEVLDVRLREKGRRVASGTNKGQLAASLTLQDCWLEFLTKRKYRPQPEWEHASSLVGASPPLTKFLVDMAASRRIPQPGDVHLVAGGPPCQGVSGLNRHAKQSDVLTDPKNRLVTTYFDLVKFLKPNYILMEQVMDVFKKQGGIYARFAVCMLVANGYQTRVGMLTAGHYGCPQGRRRVIFWGARAGVEQLPPFPEPSHKVKFFQSGIDKAAIPCVVRILPPDQSSQTIHPMILMGDALSDLPPVHNYCMSDKQQYMTDPATPYQLWMRRPPPAGSRSLAERCDEADKLMNCAHEKMKGIMDEAQHRGGLEALGRAVFCKKRNGFAPETWVHHLEHEVTGEERLKKEIMSEMQQEQVAILIGQVLVDEMRKAEASPFGPLRDHRPLLCNVDDYLRMVHVPKEKGANFRDMPGVITNRDGTCCAGSWHAAKVSEHKCDNACPGGGLEAPKSSNEKASRVDHYGSKDKGAWRGTQLAGCPSRTTWLPTGDLICPRWCVTYKKGRSWGRHGCFGRVWYDDIQSTVVTRAEPHNLQLVHPSQDRVLTIRENARCQGFPDYYVLVGLEGGRNGKNSSHGVTGCSVDERYLQVGGAGLHATVSHVMAMFKHVYTLNVLDCVVTRGDNTEVTCTPALPHNCDVTAAVQMGNAVAPPLAAALGRCLRLAIRKAAPVAVPVVSVPDAEYEAVLAEAEQKGLKFYADENVVAEKYNYLARWRQDAVVVAAEGDESDLDEDNDGGTDPATTTGVEDDDADVVQTDAAGKPRAPVRSASKKASRPATAPVSRPSKAKASCKRVANSCAAAPSADVEAMDIDVVATAGTASASDVVIVGSVHASGGVGGSAAAGGSQSNAIAANLSDDAQSPIINTIKKAADTSNKAVAQSLTTQGLAGAKQVKPAGKAGRMGTTVPAAAADGPCSPGRPRRNAAVAATAAIKRDADHDAAEPMRRHKRRVLPAGMLMSNAGGAVGQADLEEEMSGVQAVGDDDDDKSNDEQEEDEPEQQGDKEQQRDQQETSSPDAVEVVMLDQED